MLQNTDIPLDPSVILAGLSAETLTGVGNIHTFTELASTNEWLLENGVCGDVCLAEKQTAGRGRRGRVWQSPAQKNIYFSMRWCFDTVPEHYGSLSLYVGLAVARALQEVGLNGHGLKWPNDIYYNGRKLGGILLQTAQPLQQVVIGIGLNVNMQVGDVQDIDQPWCGLAEVLGHSVDRNHLLTVLLKHLVPVLRAFSGYNNQQFIQDWQQWDILHGRDVLVHTGSAVLSGKAQGIDEQGQLSVLLDSGVRQCFSSADVSVRW
uniref:biotin--[biotin carboxyl-carrier protein] ligase n=1 Tax=uncultured Thiotrichaceae bacterium TaxID=298394 RepID=A0A6S6SY07_9GAMM|nr:MAG: Biotin--[acetyl-CoA-carboxylase] ligase [uncultured Thiotrichaceae bacterium]